METIVRAACPHDCPDTCAMLVTVKDGVAVKVQGDPLHPFTDGSLCTKVSHYTERTYSPDRLQHPMKRVGPKGKGGFRRIGWDEALDEIAARMGFAEPCFRDSDDDIARQAIGSGHANLAGMDWESLKHNGWQRLALPKNFARDRRNANDLTSQRTADLGGAAAFYDCLVEVERAGSAVQ